jgi:hypothetical protein
MIRRAWDKVFIARGNIPEMGGKAGNFWREGRERD